MPTSVADSQVRTALRRAAVRATYAPSVHNTQPWTIRVGHDRLGVRVDPGRQLHVLDPTGRQMTISVGCAVMNARVALAADGIDVDVERFPSRTDPDLAAVLTVTGRAGVRDGALAALDHVVEIRQTNRRRFADDDVPLEVLDALERTAAAEQAMLHVVRDPDQRLAVASLSQRADDIENLNPAYRAELRAWTTDDPLRADGVPHLAVPHVDGRRTGRGADPGLRHPRQRADCPRRLGHPVTNASSSSARAATRVPTGCGPVRPWNAYCSR